MFKEKKTVYKYKIIILILINVPEQKVEWRKKNTTMSMYINTEFWHATLDGAVR